MAQPELKLVTTTKKQHDVVSLIKETHTQELVIPLCGPVGSPLHIVSILLQGILEDEFGYKPQIIKYSDLIREYRVHVKSESTIQQINSEKDGPSKKFNHIQEMIEDGNLLREKYGNSILSELAIKGISLDRNKEEYVQKQYEEKQHPIEYKPRRVCYILDSLKHEDELTALQAVYGGILYFIGVFSPINKRREFLSDDGVKDNEIFQLMDRDSGEEFAHGQHMRQAFTKADFFLRIDSKDRDIIKDKLSRFLHLIFGTKEMTPTIHETAMYLASSAAGNSACLSRQVGAALTDERGEILSVGWNDVPKFGGDLYKAPQRDNKEPYKDERCFKKDMGYCTNDRQKREVKGDIIDILIREKIIPAENRETAFNAMKKIQKIDSLLEYSRAIHAEMHAIILGAQKSGRKMVNGKLYCTTYPCHICARHIIVAGIKEVYYIEPYTKSLTTRLHSDAITEDESDQEKVRIRMFDGVSPSKFLQLFHVAPNSRKKNDGSGEALEINPKTASPRTTNSLQRLPELESIVVRNLDQRIKNAKE